MLFKAVLSILPLPLLGEHMTKLDPITYDKLRPMLTSSGKTMVMHYKKKFSYDSKDISDKLTIGLQGEKDVFIFDMELPDPKGEDENSGGSEDSEAEESDWKRKERIEKENAAAMMEKYDIDPTQFPYISVIRNNIQIASLKVEEDHEPSDIISFLEGHGMTIETGDVDLPEFDEAIEVFAKVVVSKKTDFSESMKKAGEMTSDLDLESDAIKKEKMGIYMKCLKSSAGKGGEVEAYLEKETKRLNGLVSSKAIAMAKRKQMAAKVACLRRVAHKIHVLRKGAEEGTEL